MLLISFGDSLHEMSSTKIELPPDIYRDDSNEISIPNFPH